MRSGGLYEDLEELDRFVSEYEQVKIKDKAKAHALKHLIIETIKKTGLDQGIRNPETKNFNEFIKEIHERLSQIRNTQIQDGMHIFGEIPKGEKKVDFIYSILRYNTGDNPSIRKEVAKALGYNLNELISNQDKWENNRNKSYGAIIEEIDSICKQIIAQILLEAKNDQY
jgi:cobaltochelatase CobN